MIILTLFRIFIVVLIAYVLSKVILGFLNKNQNSGENNNNSSTRQSNKNYIDICPECGRVKNKNHRCP